MCITKIAHVSQTLATTGRDQDNFFDVALTFGLLSGGVAGTLGETLSTMQFPDARILIFAKAPILGQVKTRLIPALGEQGALDLYRQCLCQVVKQRCQAEIAPVVLYCAPDSQHSIFQQLSKQYSLTLQQQHGDDLGERMSHAVRQSLYEAERVILTGVDAPSLTNADIQQGIQCLQQSNDMVMSPAEDGGYVMLGMRQHHTDLFSNIPWGTEQVADITRQRCNGLKRNLLELATRWDIDRPEDVMRWKKMNVDLI